MNEEILRRLNEIENHFYTMSHPEDEYKIKPSDEVVWLMTNLGDSLAREQKLRSAAERFVNINNQIKANPHYVGEEWEITVDALERALEETSKKAP